MPLYREPVMLVRALWYFRSLSSSERRTTHCSSSFFLRAGSLLSSSLALALALEVESEDEEEECSDLSEVGLEGRVPLGVDGAVVPGDSVSSSSSLWSGDESLKESFGSA